MKTNAYLVTGGGGYLGKALVHSLLKAGKQVSILARGDYPEISKLGVQVIKSDLRKWSPEVIEQIKGYQGVFHVAAKVEMWGAYSDFYQTNVIGTEHILEYCRKAQINNFVYTSSPSVVSCSGDLSGVDESFPYPKSYLAYYPATKAIAERLVLRANSDNFQALILRPHLIFGPGDTSFIPTIIRKARSGRMRVIGAGSNLVDLTYIDDCVQAHQKAMFTLEAKPSIAGRIYFISQGEPVKFWDWINQVLEQNKLPRIEKKISKSLAYILAGFAEIVAFLSNKEPLLSRFLVEELASDHYFNISAARRDFGYQPSITLAEALVKTFSHEKN